MGKAQYIPLIHIYGVYSSCCSCKLPSLIILKENQMYIDLAAPLSIYSSPLHTQGLPDPSRQQEPQIVSLNWLNHWYRAILSCST